MRAALFCPGRGAYTKRARRSLPEDHPWVARGEELRAEYGLDSLVELDQAKRSAIYRRVQEILHEELPMLLTVRPITFKAWKKKVRHYYPSVLGTYRTERIMIAP